MSGAASLGEPGLMWSFNRDGEARPGLVEHRDKQLEIDTEEVRRGPDGSYAAQAR